MPDNPSFPYRYAALEQEFRRQAAGDGAVYVPNPEPAGPVNFILVCMEPSLGRWASEHTGARADGARQAVEQGFLNFSYSYDDFVLHHAACTYLCGQGRTYHVTDISKGAMLVADASQDRINRYERWLPLLRREIDLLTGSETRVIAVGQQVAAFLQDHQLPPSLTILHYSPQAAKARKEFASQFPEQYAAFAPTVSHSDIMATFQQVAARTGLAERFRQDTETRLEKAGLTESRKMLLFTYKKSMEDLAARDRC